MTHTRAMPSRFTALALLLVVTGAGCQICGLEKTPCRNDNSFQECQDGEVCVDGLCRAARPTAQCEAGALDVTPAIRHTSFNIAGARGFFAMGNALFGLTPAIAADLDCNPDCVDVFEFPARVRAPVLGDVGAASLADGELELIDAPPPTDSPFSFELVFRTPTSSGRIASVSSGGNDQWVLATNGNLLLLDVGGTTSILGGSAGGTWSHLLCFVDPALLEDGATSGVLCAIDGGLPAAPALTAAPIDAATDARVFLGDALGNDGAVALLRMWAGRPEAFPTDNDPEVQRLVLDEARRRLLAYVGVTLETEGALLAPNTGLVPRVLELPAQGDAPGALLLVGGPWPRLTAVGNESGLVFEDTAINVLSNLASACSARVRGPTGKNDACDLDVPMSVSTNVEAGTQLTFTAWTPKAAADVQADLSDNTSLRTVTCTLSEDVGACDGADRFDAVVDDVGDMRRFRVTLRLGFTLARVTFSGPAGSNVWAPQIELADRGSSPIPFFLANGQVTNQRSRDAILISEARLGRTAEVTLTARILQAHGALFPVTALDDELLGDGVQMQARFEGDGRGVTLVGSMDGKVLEPAAILPPGLPATLTASVGDEVIGCEGCTSVPTVRGGRVQPELVLFAGPQAVMQSASIFTRGTASIPTGLDVRLGAPPLEPCSGGIAPLFAFAVCDSGLCETASAWDGGERVANLRVAGAFPGDLAATGPFTTDLSSEELVGALLLEARFETPTDGDGGELVALNNEDGLVAAIGLRPADGGFELYAENDGVRAGLTTLDPAEWNQVVCLFDDDVRCAVNLDSPRSLPLAVRLPRQQLIAATVGGAGTLSAARGWLVDRPGSDDERTALLEARAFESFGFASAPRRAAVSSQERRTSAGYASVLSPDGTFALRRVGPHWPRVEDIHGDVEYVAELISRDPLEDTSFDDGSIGPHITLRAAHVTDETRTLDGATGNAVLSIFVSELDSGDTVELNSGLGRIELPSKNRDGEAGFEDYGSWKRLWVRVLNDGGASLVVNGEVLASVPQRDRDAVLPSPVALNDVEAGDALLLRTTDLTTGFASVIELETDAQSLSGTFFTLTGNDPPSTLTFGLGLDEQRQMQARLVSRQGPNVGTPGESSLHIGAADTLRYWWRGATAVVSTGDGRAVESETQVLNAAASAAVVGNGALGPARIRLRALSVRRGDR